MPKPAKVSRRQFLHSGTGVMAVTAVAATGPALAGEPQPIVQAPPPPTTAPRVLRKPPLRELERIAGSYGLELSQDDLASFVGATRVSVNRALADLEAQGAIAIGRRHIAVKEPSLLRKQVRY